jgi:hypothetical protein
MVNFLFYLTFFVIYFQINKLNLKREKLFKVFMWILFFVINYVFFIR